MADKPVNVTKHIFQPGNTFGKNAKPRSIGAMREMAKEYTQAMLNTLVEIAMDRDERGSVRVAAADLVLTRAYGKAESYHDKPTGDNLPVNELSTAELTAILLNAKSEGLVATALETTQPLALEHVNDVDTNSEDT